MHLLAKPALLVLSFAILTVLVFVLLQRMSILIVLPVMAFSADFGPDKYMRRP